MIVEATLVPTIDNRHKHPKTSDGIIDTKTNVAHQMEVSGDNTEYASPQNQTYIENQTTADTNNVTIK